MTTPRERLLVALDVLDGRERTPAVRLALAEAEFRLAVIEPADEVEAMERLRRAIAHDPFAPKLHHHLGRLLHRSGDHVAALAEFREVLRLAPANRRTWLLAAASLCARDEPDRSTGRAILLAMGGGDSPPLRQFLPELDAILNRARRASRGRPGDPPPPARRSVHRRERPDEVGSATWRQMFVERLSAPAGAGEALRILSSASARLVATENPGPVVESCVQAVVNGEPVGRVLAAMERSGHDLASDNPALRLLRSVCDLAQIAEPRQFVAQAIAAVEDGAVPFEIVCVLHLLRFGPDADLAPADSAALLDDYPARLCDPDVLRELRVALVDALAGRAWANGRLDEAEVLWQEAASHDPHRLAAAHNLALLAARRKRPEAYVLSWDRLAELHYLHAADAGDVRALLTERRTLHQVLAEQCSGRYVPRRSPAAPTDEELAAWLRDDDAVRVWLREWDLDYLCRRLEFQSPAHLLGVPRDAAPGLLDEAHDSLVHLLNRSLGQQRWAGVAAFRSLAQDLVDHARLAASDSGRYGLDRWFAVERPFARALDRTTLDRVFLLRRMMRLIALDGAAHRLPLGERISHHLFLLPLTQLQRTGVAMGRIARNFDLVDECEWGLVALAQSCTRAEPQSDFDWNRRARDLEACEDVRPGRLELRLLRARSSLRRGRRSEAYELAVAGLSRHPAVADRPRDERNARAALVRLLDEIGEREMASILRPSAGGVAAISVSEAARAALQRFPASGAVRLRLVDNLVAAGGTDEARRLLDEGVRRAICEEQRRPFEMARDQVVTDAERHKLRKAVEHDLDQVNASVASLLTAGGGDPAVRGLASFSLAVLRRALHRIDQNRIAARQAGLFDDVEELDALRDRLTHLIDRIADDEA